MRWKERLKSALLPRADGILTAGRDGAAFAMRYRASPDRTFTVPHVIDSTAMRREAHEHRAGT